MRESLDKIAEQIIVCGVEELESHLANDKVSLVVSTCSKEECNSTITTTINAEEGGSNSQTKSAQSLIDRAYSKCVRHYQSLVYQTYGDFLDQIIPHEMTDEEEQSYFFEQAKNTLDKIDRSIKKHPDKKVIIHCVYGSDRSAMVAIAYFMKAQGRDPNMDEALKTLYKIRPGAALESISQQFRSYFGAKFDEYRNAIVDYRNTLTIRETMPLTLAAKDFFMASGKTEQAYQAYETMCHRFGMSLD